MSAFPTAAELELHPQHATHKQDGTMQATVGVAQEESHVSNNCDDLANVRRELLQWIIANEVARARFRGVALSPMPQRLRP